MTNFFRALILMAVLVFLAAPIFADDIDKAPAKMEVGDDLVIKTDTGAQAADIDEMKLLQENGIIKGDENGDLRPDDELTRAEFATILCRAIGIEDIARSAAMTEKAYFSDVAATHWAAGYINAAVEHKAINGFEDGTFRPGLSVTNEQVIKMLIAAWGYGEEAEKLGGYPNGYMEIAKRFGVTDAVLFNYGVASKRWVACSFTYGALAMPVAEDYTVDIPVQIEHAKVKEPRPENTGYVVDTVSILKRVTPQSAKYERTLFEQRVPDDFMPFQFGKNSLVFIEKSVNGIIQFFFHVNNAKEPAIAGYLQGGGNADLSALPHGQYSFSLYIIDGAVKDSYMGTVEKKQDGTVEFASPATRYTILNAQPKVTEIRHELALSSTKNNENNPFIIEAFRNQDGRPMLRVSYPFVIAENQVVDIGINSLEAGETGELYYPPVYIERGQSLEAYSYSMPLRGNNTVMDPFIIDGLTIGEPYNFSMRVAYTYGDDIVLGGTIKLLENGGELAYLFEGFIRYLTTDDYEISDYRD